MVASVSSSRLLPVVLAAPFFAACDDSKTPAPAARDPGHSFQFVDEAAARGITAQNHCGAPTGKRFMLEEIGQGCALFDMDGDGDLDAFIVDAGTLLPPAAPDGDWTAALDAPCRLFENDGHGRFQEVADPAGGLRVFGQGVVAGDYDGDGDLDLYVTCFGRNRLLQNDGRGHFTDVTAQAGVGDENWSVGAAFFDADGDGDLDLYVGNYFAMARARDPNCWNKVDCPYYEMKAACGPKGMLPEQDVFYVNNGDGTFRDASESSGIRAVEPSYALGVVAFDYDLDGDQDLYVANDSRAHYLFDNDGTGHFTESAQLAGCALSASGLAQAGMGVAVGDCDGDLDLDLFCTNFSHDDNTLYQNDGKGSFLDVTARHAFGVESWLSLGWGTEFVDFDLDGDLDLFVANGHVYPEADQRAPELAYKQLNRIYVNDDGRFRDETARSGPALARKASFRGAAFGDVDEDGDVDVLVLAQNELPSLLINDADHAAAGHWLTLELAATGPNRFAIGARVVAEIGARKLLRVVSAGGSFASMNDLRLHFGLGSATRVDRLTVRWPDGTTQEARDVAGDRKLRWRQGAAPEPRLP